MPDDNLPSFERAIINGSLIYRRFASIDIYDYLADATELMWFEDWQSLTNIIFKGVLCFGGLILLLRAAGKRTLTNMNAFDFIMTFALGSTLASIITSDRITVAQGMTALATLIAIQYVIAWLEVRSDWFQARIKSQPTILFAHGEFVTDAMRRERLTEVEVMAAMRYEGLADPSQAAYVLIETDGQLSVIPKQSGQTAYGTLEAAESFKSH